MSKETVLITGGAGFIGSHLADALLAAGHRVRALDNLEPQVHGRGAKRPSYLHRDVELVVGDVRDPEKVASALQGVTSVYHFAARVGVGQSMYEVREYVDTNAQGTAVLMEALMKKPVGRLVVASSMSIYGEGLYEAAGQRFTDVSRSLADLRAGRWDPCTREGAPLSPLPTPESKPASLASVYALTKYDQERLCLMMGAAYGIPTLALRFFNVYGPRQALSNPYTGVLAIFASRLLNKRPPVIFEDGAQRRDFVHVSDVVQACTRALTCTETGIALNVASGESRTVREVASSMARATGNPSAVAEITGEYRVGDIRHCFADIALARRTLGYAPQVPFDAGIDELASWLRTQIAVDLTDEARSQLRAHGLTI